MEENESLLLMLQQQIALLSNIGLNFSNLSETLSDSNHWCFSCFADDFILDFFLMKHLGTYSFRIVCKQVSGNFTFNDTDLRIPQLEMASHIKSSTFLLFSEIICVLNIYTTESALILIEGIEHLQRTRASNDITTQNLIQKLKFFHEIPLVKIGNLFCSFF